MLYLLRSHGGGDVSVLKLGYASDYSRRLIQYQSSNPYVEEVGKRDNGFRIVKKK